MAGPPPIGMKIKRARERLRMSQAELGAAIKVSQKTIDNWEHDRRYPKSSIGALEAVLGVELVADSSGGSTRAISPQLRHLVAKTLEDPVDQRRVLGLLEGTLTWPEPGDGQEDEESGSGAAEGEPAAG